MDPTWISSKGSAIAKPSYNLSVLQLKDTLRYISCDDLGAKILFEVSLVLYTTAPLSVIRAFLVLILRLCWCSLWMLSACPITQRPEVTYPLLGVSDCQGAPTKIECTLCDLKPHYSYCKSMWFKAIEMQDHHWRQYDLHAHMTPKAAAATPATV